MKLQKMDIRKSKYNLGLAKIGVEGKFYVMKSNWKITCLSMGKLIIIKKITV